MKMTSLLPRGMALAGLGLSLVVPAAAQVLPLRDSVRARIAALFAPFARTDAPGCVVGVFQAGTILYTGAFGMADLAHGLPLTDSTGLHIASASKQFTALAVLLLEAEGKFRLSDDIRRYVPEVPRFGPAITIRHLLDHTSGLRDYWNLFDMSGWRTSDVETESDFLWLLQRQQGLNHPTGAEFQYTNTGYTVLTLLVERVSGMPFRRFVAERIFAPLGMVRSAVQAERAQVVKGLATGFWGHDPADLRITTRPFSIAGSTGVVSTMRDLARWDGNFYSPRVGTRAMLDAMSTPGKLADGTTFGYGMGLFIGTHRGRRMISHAGSDPGYRADLIRFPGDSLSVAVLCNAFDIAVTPLALQIADLYLPPLDSARAAPTAERRPLPVPSVSPALSPSRLAGMYWHEASGGTHRFFFENDGLVLDGGGEGKFPLTLVGPDAWRLTAAPRRFVFTFREESGRLVVDEDIEGSPVRRYTKVPEVTGPPPPLQALAGSYYSAELDITWTIVLREGQLVLERHRMDPSKLTRLFGDVFLAEYGFLLEFTRATGGTPTTMDVTTERIRRIRFTGR